MARIPKLGLVMVLLFAFVAICLLGNYLSATVAKHHLDTAFLLEIAEGTRLNGEPVSTLLTAAVDGSMTWTHPASEVCSSELKPTSTPYNVLDNHAYYAIFAISALTNIVSAETVLSYLHGFSFIAILLMAYFFLRKNKVSVLGAGTFCLIVSLHPAWAFAATGDYYMDRFYMPFALAYLMGMHVLLCEPNIAFKRWAWAGLIIIGLLGAAMTERAAIMIGFATFSVLLMYWSQTGLTWRIRIVLGMLGGLFLAYAYWYIRFRFVGVSTGGSLSDLPRQILHAFDRYSLPMSKKLLIIFLGTNIGFLGLFAFFSGWRTALIALIALLPNIIVTVGGAELSGWSTHYHSMYFPFLVYCSLIGFININKNEWVAKHKFAKGMIFAIPIVFGLIYNPYDGFFHSPSTANFDTGITRGVWDFYVKPSASPDRQVVKQAAVYNAALPSGSKITTVEGLMPSIYRNNVIYYYPVGIDSADYAVLGKVSQPDGSFYYAGAINYTAEGAAQQLDKCLNERLIRAGYQLDKPLLIGNLAILKRH